MVILLYIILILLCIFIGYKGLKYPSGIYQFPFGAAAVFLGFIVPPLLGLLHADYLPQWGIERYILMCILCLLMCWLGDSFAKRRARQRIGATTYDPKRWLGGSTILILVGAVAWLKHRSLFEAGSDMSTGVTVAVGFFVIPLRYGFIMALIHLLRTKNRYALILGAFAAMYYLDRIVFLGRRRDLIEFAFVVAGSAWFVLHKAIPRIVVVSAVIIMTIFFFSTGFYRSVIVSTTGERDWSELKDLDLVGTFREICAEGSSETVAGIYLMSATAAEKAYGFGLYHWNILVFNYVPAQLFGSAFKESFYLPVVTPIALAEQRYGYTPNYGSTVTGMVDCYGSFWYLGCLKFFVIAYIMQRLYRRAISGSVIGQMIYLFMMANALQTITHHTQWFFSPWVHIFFFWLPVMFYATRVGGNPATLKNYR